MHSLPLMAVMSAPKCERRPHSASGTQHTSDEGKLCGTRLRSRRGETDKQFTILGLRSGCACHQFSCASALPIYEVENADALLRTNIHN